MLLSSFGNLAALYGYEPVDVSGMVFPLNLAALYRQAAEALAEKDKEVKPLLLEDEGRIRLATAKAASTGSFLFYLPVYPLWKWMREGKRKREVTLVLSLFAYLHQTIGIPFFNGWSYIGGKYEMMQEWLAEDDSWEDDEEYFTDLTLVKTALWFGERLHRQVKHPYHLKAWEDRLRGFSRQDDKAEMIWDIANRFWELRRNYPDRSLSDNIHPQLLQSHEEERMTMDQIFSFIWTENGWLGEQLFDTVVTELQECCAADEPLALQYFDTPQAKAEHDVGFETKLYELLHELSDVLRQML